MGFLDKLLDAFSGDEQEDTDPRNETATRMYTNHAGGYYVCSHRGCIKKVDESIPDHDCCGRCLQGRDCRQAAAVNYVGPGSFFHEYWETVLQPGVCGTCGERPELH